MNQNSLGGAGDLRPDEKEILAAEKRKLQKRYNRWTVCITAVLLIALTILFLGKYRGWPLNDPSHDPDSLESSESERQEPSAPVQLEWTEWQDSLPNFVSAAEYSIEEQTVYCSQILETTSSTSQTTMEGWECYDTVQGNGEFGAWSEWSPNAVDSSDTREVGTQTRYRYRDKEFDESSSVSMSGWELYDTTYQWGSYGGWSGWTTDSISGSDSRQVETKTQYSYRDISYSTEYTPWSGWSGWQWNRESTSDLKQEDTQNVWGYYYFECTNCGAHMHGYGTCWTWAGGCGCATQHGSTAIWHEVWSPTAWSDAGLKDWHGTGKYYTFINGELVFKYSDASNPQTKYRYRTRSTQQVASYGNWSSWSDTSYSSSSSREVQTRTMYRYRDRQQMPTYHYWKWGNWSNWSESAVSETSSRQVETATYYRSRDKVFMPTYYFRRWGDWSEYSADVVEPSDTVEVQTKTQYRYKSK